MTEVISCCELVYTHGGRSGAIQGVSARFFRGTVNYIVGPSGAGKTTLALLFAGVFTPESGNVRRPQFELPGLVLQFPEELFLTDSVEEELALIPDSEAEGVVLEALNELGLPFSDIFNQRLKSLSFGQKRLFAAALQTALSASVMIFDEPTLGLDERNLSVISNWIKSRCDNDMCAIVVTHDLDLMKQLPGTVIALDRGKIVWSGETCELLRSKDILNLTNLN